MMFKINKILIVIKLDMNIRIINILMKWIRILIVIKITMIFRIIKI
jgi:hypothetical protein